MAHQDKTSRKGEKVHEGCGGSGTRLRADGREGLNRQGQPLCASGLNKKTTLLLAAASGGEGGIC